ncbi:MAG TPA: triose-phosphate isomerase [Bacteroidales bacterium]|nr:triose-phosphate isomerase [Bacteroidales bacterium]HPT11340.1 triose-phosphate isomerase [Bacteroidales bacterium]
MRKKIVAGNWKMNMDYNEGIELASGINSYFTENPLNSNEVILCTPFIHLHGVASLLSAKNVSAGAQNCNDHKSGAYTGEVSAAMIKSTGASYVIIGHSERRTIYKEDDALLATKTNEALRNELKVIFCCGEILAEREKSIHFDVVKRQLESGIFTLTEEDFHNIVIAYEPVWAIGTGVTASPAQAQEMHHFIRGLVEKRYGKKIAENTTILYGGSCKASNAAELFANADVDGGLIGGASLTKDEFCNIVKAL